MFLFISEISGPWSTEEFVTLFQRELLGKFREHEIVAAGWIEHGVQTRPLIQGWSSVPPQEIVEKVVASVGGTVQTRAFLPIIEVFPSYGIFPSPSPQTVQAVCDMPNNRHLIPQSAAPKHCQQGHAFDDHKITKCVICGGNLT